VELDGVRFVGCTLWTDFRVSGDQASGMAGARDMTDYRLIRVSPGFRRLRPADTLGWHLASVGWLRRNIEPGRTVVVTHHAPSPRSLDVELAESRFGGAYASDLEGLIHDTRPLLWIHGHLHRRQDYRIGETRVICNPRGYPDEAGSTGFEEGSVVEV
jgi:hypothetical protein